jgi:hypothetical protein
MLKFRYSRIHEPWRACGYTTLSTDEAIFKQRKEERRVSFEPAFAGHSPRDTGSNRNRRYAFEMDRKEIDLEQALTDVANWTMYRGHDLLSRGAHIIEYEGTADLVKDTTIPRSLFSPKRYPIFAYLSITDIKSMGGGSRSLKKTTYRGDRQGPETNIGSARFSQAEVEEMARQAFGGTTTARHHWSEFLLQSIEKDEKTEEDGDEIARKIWERMRVNSEASGTSAKSTDVRFSDESAESGRECQVVGTPRKDDNAVDKIAHFTSVNASSGEFYSQPSLSTADGGGIGIHRLCIEYARA